MPTGFARYLTFGLIALGLIALIVVGVRGCKQIDADQDNIMINAGETSERAKGQSEVINNVKEARDAVDNPTPDERNVVCSKYNRNCPDGQ